MITPATEILNQKGTPMFNSDLFANRPAAGIAGRIFISTDTKELYRDTGTTWELLSAGSGGTVTGTGSATQVAFWTGSSAIGGNNDLWWDNANKRLGIGNNAPAANLDIHGNNATIQIDGRSTSSAYIQFLTQGSAKWRIGNISTGNYFQIFDNASSIERVKIENNGSLTLLGYYNAIRTETATAGNGFHGLYSWDVMTIPSSTSFTNIGNSFGSIVGRNNMTYQGGATFGNANVTTAILGTNIFDFSSGSGTITINQGTGIRSFSALTAFNQVNSATTGTISHLSSIQVLAPYSQSGTMNVTNYYGLLINASNERTALNVTNRWGIYQDGSLDKNYFGGNLLVRSNVDNGNALQVTGNATISGNIDTLSATFTSTITANGSIQSNDQNAFILYQAGNPLDTKYWSIQNLASSGTFRIRALNDAITAGINAIEIVRNGISEVNVGIGITPNSWTTLRGLQNGRANLVGYASNIEGAWFTNNAYFDLSWKYQTTSQATMYQQLSGVHSWHIASSGTLNTPITFTQALTLNTSGNLQLGTTSGGNWRFLCYQNASTGSATSSSLMARQDGNDDIAQFWYSGTNIGSIKASGNLLLGTTTDNGNRLQVVGSAHITSYISVINNAGTGNALEIVANSGSDRSLFLAGILGVTNGLSVRYVNSTTRIIVNIKNIPTSPVGLISGDIYSNAGVLTIVP